MGRSESAQRPSGSGSRCAARRVASAPTSAGSIGFDGLLVIRPDGRIYRALRHRQPRHPLGVRRPPVAAEVLGMPWDQVRRHLGQHGEESPVELPVRRQPDDARDDAGRTCGRHGRQEEAAGDRGQGPRRQARATTRWPRARVSRGRGARHDVRAGSAAGDRARRQIRRPRGARGRERDDEGVGDRSGGSGSGGAASDTYPRDGITHSSVVGSPRSKWTSRPACSASSTCSPSPTSARSSTRAAWGQMFGGDARDGPRHRPEMGLRSALRRQLPSASTTPSRPRSWTSPSRCSGGPGHSGSGDAGRRARHRRAARGSRCGAILSPFRRARRRDLPARR